CFDTAHCYSFFEPGGTGASELALADYFRRRGGFGDAVIATKGGHPSAPGYRTVDRYLSPERLAADIDDSLGRLGIDCIDLYWLHRDDLRLEVGEIVEALNHEIKKGRIRYLGASNWTAARIDAANRYATTHGWRGFVGSQPEWCLAHPNADVRPPRLLVHFFDDADARWHEQSQIPVVPYTSTAGGYFATGGQAAREGFDNPTSRARLARVEELAKQFGRPPSQIATAYLTSQPFPVIPILGTKRVDHLRDAMCSLEVKLTPEQVAWLRDG
ncbi:aldo/keto reductase, partial [bacterium]|nr:aldo/keto reductase [bacterium]